MKEVDYSDVKKYYKKYTDNYKANPDKYYLGSQELMALDPDIIKELGEQDKRVFAKIMGNIAIAAQSESIQELDYFFIKNLLKKNPNNLAVETVFYRLDNLLPKKYEQGFDSVLTETDDTADKDIENTNSAKVKALKKVAETKWVGNTVHETLDKCLVAINLDSTNSGWYKPIAARINGLSGIYMLNQDGSIFCEARVVKEGEKQFRIECLTTAGWNEFESLLQAQLEDGGRLRLTLSEFKKSFNKIDDLHGARYVSIYYDKPIRYSDFTSLYEIEGKSSNKHDVQQFRHLKDAIDYAYEYKTTGKEINFKFKVGDIVDAETPRDGFKESLKISKALDFADGNYYDAGGYYSIPEKNIKLSVSKTITVHVPLSSSLIWNAGMEALGDMSKLSEEQFLKVWKYVLAANYMFRNNIDVSNYKLGKKNQARHFSDYSWVGAQKNVDLVNVEFKRRGLENKYSLFIERDEEKIQPAWESNIQALVNPETGLAATVRNILEAQKPYKDAFLKRIGLSLEEYHALDKKGKDKIHGQWVKSKEFEHLSNVTEKPQVEFGVTQLHENQDIANVTTKFPSGEDLLEMKVKEIVWASGDLREQIDNELEPLAKELKLLHTSYAAVRNNPAERNAVREQIDALSEKCGAIDARQEQEMSKSWDALVEYLKVFSVDTGLLTEADVEDGDGDFGELTGYLSQCIWEEAYRERTWDSKLFDVWLDIVADFTQGEDIKLNRDYTVPTAQSELAGTMLPLPVIPFVEFMLRTHSATLIYAGYDTAMPVTIADMLPAWKIEFLSEDKLLSQEDILIAFDCRVKVIVKQTTSTSSKVFFKTYFILPYKVGPYDPQIARKYFIALETALAKNKHYRETAQMNVSYLDKLKRLNKNLKLISQDVTEKMLYIDVHTSYSKEQLIVFFTAQPEGTIFKVKLFGEASGWKYEGLESSLVKEEVFYRLNELKKTPEDVANMILGSHLVVMTEKSHERKVVPETEPYEPKGMVGKSWVNEPVLVTELPTPKISLEFDIPSEYGTTTCVVEDVRAVADRGFCSCGDGSDYKFNAFEIAQLRDIAETGEIESFTQASKLEYPLNWVAKMKVDNHALLLPTERMTAKEYADVKNILQKAGGSYKKNSFIFEEPAADIYLRILSGEDYNLKKKFQYYPTPAATGDYMVKLADIKCGMSFCEPSAGRGSLINAIHRVCPDAVVDYWEIMELNRKYLQEIPNTNFMGVMFENALEESLKRYDRIIANPPFSNNQDENHIQVMYKLLKPKGRLVTVSSTHWQNAKEKKSQQFREWISKVKAEVIEVPEGTFKESGTMIPTLIIVINKP